MDAINCALHVCQIKHDSNGDISSNIDTAHFPDHLTWEGQQLSAEVAASPAFLAAFYIQQAHCKVFKLPIMSTQYTWTKKLVDGLKLFCDWHLALVHHQTLMSQDTNADHILGKYRSSIDLLKQYLAGGGVASKISDATSQRLMVKARVDRERLRMVPTLKEMRSGVKQAMLFLQDLEERTKKLERDMRDMCYAAMGFDGRKRAFSCD